MTDLDWQIVCNLLPFMILLDRQPWFDYLVAIKGPVPDGWVARVKAALKSPEPGRRGPDEATSLTLQQATLL
jgi:hypothetical protein